MRARLGTAALLGAFSGVCLVLGCGLYRDLKDAAKYGREAAKNAAATTGAAKETARGLRDVILDIAPYAGAAAIAALGGREIVKRRRKRPASPVKEIEGT